MNWYIKFYHEALTFSSRLPEATDQKVMHLRVFSHLVIKISKIHYEV